MPTLSRRDFLKLAALAAGSVVASSVSKHVSTGGAPSFDPLDSYWAREQPPPNPPLTKDLRADVAVVGGGFTGLSAAWHLARARPDLRIVLLEARGVGHGASGRNGGMVLPQTPDESMQIDDDAATHHWTYYLTVGSMDALAKFVEDSGVACDLELNGYLHVFTWPEDTAYYADYVARAQALGLPLELLDARETATKLGTTAYAGAVYDPNGGSVHPMKLIRALKHMAEAQGVEIYENSPVVHIRQGSTLALRVGSEGAHTVWTPAVILATNAYSANLGFFRARTVPLHTQCLVTEPLRAAQREALGWRSRLPFYDSRTLLYHFVWTPDHRIVMGGGDAEYFFNNDTRYRGNLARARTRMAEELRRVFPVLQDVRIEGVWNGVLSVTWDEHPSVGVTGVADNVFYAVGYNGHGINLAFLFGRILADLYQRKSTTLWRYAAFLDYPLPWMPPEPWRWLGAQAMLSAYRRERSRTG